MNRLAAAFERGERGNIADGTVKPLLVVDSDVLRDQPLGILLRQRHARPNTFTFNRLVPTFQFSVGLSRQLHLMRSMAADDSRSLTRFTPGRVKNSNSSRIFTPGVSTGPIFIKKVST